MQKVAIKQIFPESDRYLHYDDYTFRHYFSDYLIDTFSQSSEYEKIMDKLSQPSTYKAIIDDFSQSLDCNAADYSQYSDYKNIIDNYYSDYKGTLELLCDKDDTIVFETLPLVTGDLLKHYFYNYLDLTIKKEDFSQETQDLAYCIACDWLGREDEKYHSIIAKYKPIEKEDLRME